MNECFFGDSKQISVPQEYFPKVKENFYLIVYYESRPIIFRITPLYKQFEVEDVEALSSKAGEIGKIGNMQTDPQVERRTFCLVNVAT